jgi:hypothetical protein
LGKELRALRNFSIGHFNDRGELEANSPVVQALTELDGALTDLGSMNNTVGEDDSKPLMSKEEARQAVQGKLLAVSSIVR